MHMQGKDTITISPVAYIQTDLKDNFAVPRQSRLCPALCGKIHFTKPYARYEAVRELEGFSHIWLLFGFSKHHNTNTGLTVRPPRLGGNQRVGVFASRAPFRPNGLGLSCVELLQLEYDENGCPSLLVGGVDLADETPIYDIKPYLPLTDSVPYAREGYTKQTKMHHLNVICPPALLICFSEKQRKALLECLQQDPRPGYSHNSDKRFGFSYAGHEITFTVTQNTLTVEEIH